MRKRKVIVTLEFDTDLPLAKLGDRLWWKNYLGAGIANPLHHALCVDVKTLRTAKKNAAASQAIRDAKRTEPFAADDPMLPKN